MHILGIGTPELIIILVVALLIFGPKNLPKLGQAIGRSAKGLRDGMEGTESDADNDLSMSRVDRAAKRLAEDRAHEKAEKAAAAHAKAQAEPELGMAFGSGALCTHEGLRPGSLQLLAGKQLDEALRELRAQLLFELGELVRERRLGHVEPLGGSRDLPLFRNRDKVLQLLDIHAPRLSRACAFAPVSSCNSIQALNRTYQN